MKQYFEYKTFILGSNKPERNDIRILNSIAIKIIAEKLKHKFCTLQFNKKFAHIIIRPFLSIIINNSTLMNMIMLKKSFIPAACMTEN